MLVLSRVRSQYPRRRRPLLVLGTAGLATALLVGLSGPVGAAPTAPPVPVPDPGGVPGRYVVTMAAEPLAAYDGGVPGLSATKPKEGAKVELGSTAARRYLGYLRGQQDRVARAAGVRPAKRYAVAVSAFTTTMSAQQARAVARTPGVLGVSKDTKRELTDDKNSVDYLRLSGATGVWNRLGGTARAGRGVVIGVLDSGIWPENPSFAGPALRTTPTNRTAVPYRVGNRVTMRKGDGGRFVGACEAGERFSVANCNSKLIGARAFSAGFEAAVPPAGRADYDSPRDADGHGSHTAGTAGGNAGVRAVVDGIDFGRVSGVAPAAKIAAYKVCYDAVNPEASGCYTTDTLAAIEAAITDGVDVINYSISGSQDLTDPVELSFLSAASAGIFVAASAGNSGPGASTTNHESPWVTTVAANTIAPYYGTVRLGNGSAYAGVSTSVDGQAGPAPLVNSTTLAAAGQTADNARLCAPNALDPARTAGRIVVCDRGEVARLDKSAEVKRAGGVGMVLVNVTESSLDADLHFVPTVHVNPPASAAVKAYAETAGATATLLEGNQTSTTIPYPQVAGFSARGPAVAPKGNLIKPDLSAPGVAILAAYSPDDFGRSFDFLSGTSMSSPHVAGLAALWFGVRPRWSPMNIKSALMTTARNTRTATGGVNTDPYAQGAGEVVPSKMISPGLVYPSGPRDWFAYLEGQGVATGAGVAAQDPSDYNSPSIAIGSLLQSQTVTRRVRAVEPGTYRASASVPGVSVRVSPSTLTFDRPGQTKTFRVTFANRSVPFDQAATGSLTWRGAGNTVRIPVAVTPRALEAPEQVSGSGASGSIDYTATPGVTGRFPLTTYGLAAGQAQTGSVSAGKKQEYPITTPAGTKLAQFTVRTPNAQADLDLYLYLIENGAATLVAQSATGAANETITVPNPPPGEYVAVVSGFSDQVGTTTTPYTFRAAAVQGTAGVGNLTVTPNPVDARAGQPQTLRVSWSGLEATTPYIGLVEYPDGSRTIVSVN